ncbi:MAG: hypothetical protein M4579_001492 [Chaenotheca gracillima]|nr:MAG: hypothetical protein M4579_001492 [Chaenotheca gracillima]
MSSNEGATTKAPDSTLARSFSASLNDAFNIEGDLGGLSETVEQKKQAVTTQSQELQALEERLRKTEEALKLKQQATQQHNPSRNNSNRRAPLEGAFDPPPDQTRQRETQPSAIDPAQGRPTGSSQGRQTLASDGGADTPSTPSGMPGALPA